jgi:hypothetical protein
LNRLAAAFLVLMPLGRRIKINQLSLKKSAKYSQPFEGKQGLIWEGTIRERITDNGEIANVARHCGFE